MGKVGTTVMEPRDVSFAMALLEMLEREVPKVRGIGEANFSGQRLSIMDAWGEGASKGGGTLGYPGEVSVGFFMSAHLRLGCQSRKPGPERIDPQPRRKRRGRDTALPTTFRDMANADDDTDVSVSPQFFWAFPHGWVEKRTG